MKRVNNKYLLIAVVVLALLALIMVVFDKYKGERTFRAELFSVDSTAVTSIIVYPKDKTKTPINLIRNGKSWEVKQESRSYPADTAVISRILKALVNVKTERVAATGKDGYKGLEITDSLSSRVVVNQGKSIAADFRLGKISFSRNNNSGNGQNQNVDVKSYIRVADDEKVYAVDGFLSMMFSDNTSMYRNRMVFRFNKTDITKITFIYPGDSSYQLVKSGVHWMINDTEADSAKTETWLSSVANCTGSDFADGQMQPFSFPYTCRFEGNNMKTIEVKGALNETGKLYFIKSTFNPPAIFGGSNAHLFNQVFPGKAKFMKEQKVSKKKSLH